MPNTLKLAGHVFDNTGAAVGATIQRYEAGTTTTKGASATASTSTGKWAFTDGGNSYDVKITYGTNVRWLRGLDELNVSELTVIQPTNEGHANLYLVGDNAENAGDSWRVQGSGTGSSFAVANNLNDTNTFVDQFTLTAHATTTSTILAVTGNITVGHDLSLTADSSVFNMGAGNDFTITHDGTTGATIAGNPVTITAGGSSVWSTSTGSITIDGDDGIILQTSGSGNVTVSEILYITDATDASDASGDTGALRTEGGASIAKKLYVGTDLDVDGTANLDAVDIDGAVQIDNTITVGADDQGYDIIFYGDAASANMTWDTSEDDLILNGAARIVIPDGQLVLGSTAVSSNAAELNLLDGVSGLVQADLTKLAAIDSTATEINLIDGGTARGTTSVASGDGILINDAGTMRMTNVDTVSTYFSSHNVGGTNIVTVGTIGTGTWQGTAIASGYIAADAITNAKIADNAIDSEHYTDGSIDNDHLADDAVDSDEIAAGAIDTAHIADNQVTLAKMAGLARGKIIYGDASGAPAALAVGTAGYILQTDGTDLAYSNSLLAADYVIGEDAQTKIDFETNNEIHFDVDNAQRVNMTSAGIVMADDTSITFGEAGKIDFGDEAPADNAGTGIIFSFIAGTSLAIGDVVYMHTDGEVAKADADAVTSMPAIGICVSSGSDGSAVDVMVQGIMHDTSAFPSFTVGNDVFVSTDPGLVSDTAPSGSGDTVQKVGVALHADMVYFNFNTTEILLS